MDDPTIKMGATKPESDPDRAPGRPGPVDPTLPGSAVPGPAAPAGGRPVSERNEPWPAQPAWGAAAPAAPAAGPQQGASESATVLMNAPAAMPSFAWLAVVASPAAPQMVGRVLTLQASTPTTIGRLPENDIVLPDPSCSGHHARIWPKSENQPEFMIYDVGSSNGLYVGARGTYQNDESRVYRRALHDGDYILIGQTTLVFKQV